MKRCSKLHDNVRIVHGRNSKSLIVLNPHILTLFSEPIWKVCRYSSSAPAVILEKDDYVDGGVLANNPSECGLTRIQSHYKQRGEKLPISLVVSIGSGLLPPTKLGSVDLLDFKNFAQHFANRDLGERVKSLGSVVFNAVSANRICVICTS